MSKIIYLNHKREEFGDARILANQVSTEELSALEKELISMYLQEARRQRKPVLVHTDQETYEILRSTGKLFDKDDFHLLVEGNLQDVMDMGPIIYRFLDTPIAKFYAKAMLQRERHP